MGGCRLHTPDVSKPPSARHLVCMQTSTLNGGNMNTTTRAVAFRTRRIPLSRSQAENLPFWKFYNYLSTAVQKSVDRRTSDRTSGCWTVWICRQIPCICRQIHTEPDNLNSVCSHLSTAPSWLSTGNTDGDDV
ncbi:hypothetical protein Taro_051619 [Colocasia esculenta]|uniref:Uncharacterized protein n=1 Tax=Colocasia esculenta TaxID=4460 RepID=A0A843XHA4_COLES|nr:hypothetical protein [Colocasia esculenta]